MTRTKQRIADFKNCTGVYSYDRAEAENERLRAERKLLRERIAMQDEASRDRTLSRTKVEYDRSLWVRAAMQLGSVYGACAGAPAVADAVATARANMRGGKKARASMALACDQHGVGREELCRAILAMKGSK
jgi:hypothetical protein